MNSYKLGMTWEGLQSMKYTTLLQSLKFLWIVLVSLLWVACTARQTISLQQAGLLNLVDAIPGIVVEVRYYGSNNFIGQPVDGYQAEKIYLSAQAVERLARVQNDLAGLGLGLKVYDGYRPQRAVDHFVRWAEDVEDTRMKQDYYPDVEKENLFNEGYIATRSGHSRGSTVDLTIVNLRDGIELDMGSPWDFFDPISWPDNDSITAQQRENRMLLRSVMTRHGFVPLSTEWWHFTLENEPFPDSYFDFEIR